MKVIEDAYNINISFDQRRREIRSLLFIQRQLDQDNTEARLFNDAIKLDAQLVADGFNLLYPNEWARSRLAKQPISNSRTYLEVDVADLFIKGDK